MPGTEELMARLQQLENGYYGDKEDARQKQFFDTYGSRFSNNHGLGLAILNELDARGVDTSAADEAVTSILDQLRTECNEIIDSIKGVQEAAIQSAQKVEAIGNVVSQAVAANPDASLPPEGDMTVPPVDTPALDDMDPEGEFNPDIAATVPEEEPPMEEPAPAEPPMEEPPMEEPPVEEPAPDTTVSDARMKNIRSTFAARRAKRASSDFKPSSNLLSIASRGY